MMTGLDFDRLAAAREQSVRLKRLLDDEFAALRSQSLDRFEELQLPKSGLLAELSEIVASHQAMAHANAQLPGPWLTAWESFRITMLECRDLHRRNELLILRKREAIQGALSALVSGADRAAPSVDLYNRLGKMSRPGRRQAYSGA